MTRFKRSALYAAFVSGLVAAAASVIVAAPTPAPTPAPGAEPPPAAALANEPPIGAMVSATTEAALRPPGRIRLALVLSGGGARGAAHIGVLKVLEEHHVVPDLVVGTSMGSIIGGLYAAGWAPGEIETFLTETDFSVAFTDRVGREAKTYRRKKDDDLYLIQAKIRFKGFKPWLPRGVLGGQRLDLLLHAIEYTSTGENDFDAYPVPYRAVAADLVSGETVVIGEGSLAKAMRASMAVPGAFAPIELSGRTLVDGGAVANLPIRVARALGAERIIAVDITTPLTADAGQITSFLSVMDQNSTFLTAGNRLVDVANLTPEDIYIVPELGDIGFMNFKRAPEAIGIGETAARGVADRLAALRADDAAWIGFQDRHHRRPEAERVVDRVAVVNEAPIDDDILERRIEVPIGQPIEPHTFPERIMPLKALENIGPIETRFERGPEGGELTLRTSRAPYGRNSLELGLNLENDFEGTATYGLTARHQLLAVNRLGGEWQNILQGGSSNVFESQFYQPFGDAMRWFLAPRFRYRSDPKDIWVDGDNVAEYRVDGREMRIDAGTVFGDWGEFRLGLTGGRARERLVVGLPLFPEFEDNLGDWRAEFNVDTLDTTAFARRGTRVHLEYGESVEWLGTDIDYRWASFAAGQAMPFGRGTVVPSVEVTTRYDDAGTTLLNAYGLGGFLRLSGLATDELLGTRGGLARLMYYYQMANLNLGALTTKAYLGMSLEAGNVYFEADPVTWDSLRYGASIFVGAETVLGPAYLAWGYTEGGNQRFYLSIGRRY
jgi:NTE family protein